MKKSLYKVFGLVIESDIELPELAQVLNVDPDISIQLGETGTHLPEPRSKGVLYETSEKDFLFRIDSVASYRVRNGNEIFIQPNPSATPEEVRLFLYGSTMGALLHQRGILPLHGSTIISESGALIIIGYSSAGKSSLAAKLSEFGYRLLADDISAIARDSSGQFVVFPGIPYLKLWKDVVRELNLPDDLEKVRPQIEKFKYPYNSLQQQDPALVSGVCVLVATNEREMKATKISGAKKFTLLKTHTYRTNYVDGLGMSEQHFQNISEFAREIPLFEVTRPNSPMMLEELSRLIEREIISQL